MRAVVRALRSGFGVSGRLPDGLPPPDATEKIQRYEAHLDRQFYRAMDELERLQRRRRGEAVPLPVNINVGRRR
jgi:hypothetical protein